MRSETKKAQIMCTYTLTLDDKLVEWARPMFRDQNDMQRWMQSQMEFLFAQYIAIHSSKKTSKPKLSERLRGIGAVQKGFDYKNELANSFEE